MTTPSEVYDDAKEFAEDLRDDAVQALENAQLWIDTVGGTNIALMPTDIKIDGITKLDPPKGSEFGDAPDTDPIDFMMPLDPEGLGDIETLPEVDTTGAPTFGEKAPTFKPPNTPSPHGSRSVSTPSVRTDFGFPDPPAALGTPLETITFSDHRVPDAPTIGGLPELSVQPVMDVAAPTRLAENFESGFVEQRTQLMTLAQAYTEEMINKYAPGHVAGMAALEAKLSAYLEGGTGLKPEVEDAIYSRAQAKNDKEAKRVQDAVLADTAARGFTLPGGAMVSALARARQDAANLNAAKVNEIIIMQAELEQKNAQFAVTTSASVRTTVLQLTTQWMQALVTINGQALDAAKAVMAAVIEAYNSAVRVYTIKLEAWKAEVALIDARVKLILADVEVYKGQITALQAEYQVDQMKIDRLKAQVGMMSALAEVYKTRVESVVSQASLEKLKIDIYQGQIQAYTATVQAKNAEWQGYTAQISGFSAEAQAYGARVSAYNAEAQAYKTKIEAQTGVLQATVAGNQATVDAYKAGVSAFSAKVQAETGHFQGNLQTKQAAFSSYKARIEFATAKYNTQLSFYSKESARILEEAREKFNAQSRKAELFLKLSESTGAAAIEVGKVSGAMAQTALSGLNALAVTTETL